MGGVWKHWLFVLMWQKTFWNWTFFKRIASLNNRVIFLTEFSSNTNSIWPVIVSLIIPLAKYGLKHLMHFQSETSLFKFLWCSFHVALDESKSVLLLETGFGRQWLWPSCGLVGHGPCHVWNDVWLSAFLQQRSWSSLWTYSDGQ